MSSILRASLFFATNLTAGWPAPGFARSNHVPGDPSFVTTTNCTARFVSVTTIPDTLSCPIVSGGDPVAELTPAPTYGFPYLPTGQGENGSFAIGWGIDNHMKTPYAHAFDFSVARELPGNFSIEVSYVGRLGHRLLQEVDLAQPLDIKDPSSGMTYNQAATILAKAAQAGVSEDQIQRIPYFENLFPSAAGAAGISGYATGTRRSHRHTKYLRSHRVVGRQLHWHAAISRHLMFSRLRTTPRTICAHALQLFRSAVFQHVFVAQHRPQLLSRFARHFGVALRQFPVRLQLHLFEIH